MKPRSATSSRLVAALLAALVWTCAMPVQAQQGSELSEFSVLPIAFSVAIPAVLVSDVGALVIMGVETSGEGVAWVVENTATGIKTSVRFTANAVGASAVAIGTVVAVTAISTGWVISTAGRAIAFVPNEIGKSLLYNERVSR